MIKAIPAASTLDLRQRVLRPFASIEACVYDCDALDTTLHFGYFLSDLETPISILTLLENTLPYESEAAALQLRGMAVDPLYHGKGYGSLLLQHACAFAQEKERVLCCNARLTAVSFYQRNGFKTHGEVFEYPNEPRLGPHIVMVYE